MLGELLSIGGSLLGGFLNNKAADRRQEDSQDFSAQQFATRYQTTVKDMQSAGLNPMLAYGQGGGNAPTSSAASSSGYPDIGSSYNQSRQVGLQAQMTSAQVANIAADTENKKAQADLIAAQAAASWASAGQSQALTKQADATVEKIKSEIPNILSENRNINEQYHVLRATIDQLAALNFKLTEEGYTQAFVRAQLKATISKLSSETKLNNLDIDAAEKFSNVGRDYKQVAPIVDLLKEVLRSRR